MDIEIKHPNLSEIAYKKIKSMILKNTLKPGEKIVQEKMAKQLGISKIPLIQALTILENERLIKSYSRRGFFVREISKNELNNILDVRLALEVLSVSSLTKNITNKEKLKLLKFLEVFGTYFKEKDLQKYHETDRKFHYFLIESSKNDLIKDINENFNILLLSYIKGFFIDIKTSYAQHKEIINAIINNEQQKAEVEMKNHMNKIKEELNKTRFPNKNINNSAFYDNL